MFAESFLQKRYEDGLKAGEREILDILVKKRMITDEKRRQIESERKRSGRMFAESSLKERYEDGRRDALKDLAERGIITDEQREEIESERKVE